jgi:hypothetical protein
VGRPSSSLAPQPCFVFRAKETGGRWGKGRAEKRWGANFPSFLRRREGKGKTRARQPTRGIVPKRGLIQERGNRVGELIEETKMWSTSQILWGGRTGAASSEGPCPDHLHTHLTPGICRTPRFSQSVVVG